MKQVAIILQSCLDISGFFSHVSNTTALKSLETVVIFEVCLESLCPNLVTQILYLLSYYSYFSRDGV